MLRVEYSFIRKRSEDPARTHVHPRKSVYITYTREDGGEREEEKEKKECDWGVYDPCVNTGS